MAAYAAYTTNYILHNVPTRDAHARPHEDTPRPYKKRELRGERLTVPFDAIPEDGKVRDRRRDRRPGEHRLVVPESN